MREKRVKCPHCGRYRDVSYNSDRFVGQTQGEDTVPWMVATCYPNGCNGVFKYRNDSSAVAVKHDPEKPSAD